MKAISRIFLLFFVIILTVSFICGSSSFRCDYRHIPGVGWMKPHIVPANWAEARLRCKMEGANLASPLNLVLYREMLYLYDNFFQLPYMYTGIHATFSSGDYYSVEGVPLNKIPQRWAVGEPDNKNDAEKCMALDRFGNMSDVNCRIPYPYICYRPDENLVINECGTIDNAYQLDKRTGSCYKFHRTPRIWSRAFLACSAEGGYLAIINSKDEAAVLRDVYAKNPAIDLVGTSWFKDWIFMGFQDWGERGDWSTIQGQSLAEAGYDSFEAGQPDNSTIIGPNVGEFCGSIFRDAKLNDLWCVKPHAFICEKDPKSLQNPNSG